MWFLSFFKCHNLRHRLVWFCIVFAISSTHTQKLIQFHLVNHHKRILWKDTTDYATSIKKFKPFSNCVSGTAIRCFLYLVFMSHIEWTQTGKPPNNGIWRNDFFFGPSLRLFSTIESCHYREVLLYSENAVLNVYFPFEQKMMIQTFAPIVWADRFESIKSLSIKKMFWD